MTKAVRIALIESAHLAVATAARELRRCLTRMLGGPVTIVRRSGFRGVEKCIWVGAREAFDGALPSRRCPVDERDDEILVERVGASTVITGSNGRSVLFAVYRFLGALGAAWPAPGRRAEVLPRVDAKCLDGVRLREKAASRHRGMCIEGGCSIKDVLDMVDWMPKHGYNAYFLQFRTSQFFYNRYHVEERRWLGQPYAKVSTQTALDYDDQVIAAARQRGLAMHRVGHGWTSSALGMDCLGWYKTAPRLAPSERRLLARVNGRRELAGGIAINTELCYSNGAARRILIRTVADYADEHSEVDYLHVWLSDGHNNFCECPACRRKKPSEWYARVLCELGDEMSRRSSKARIVFLCYANLLEPP